MKRHYDVAQEELSFYGNEGTSLQNILAVLIGPKANASITGQLASLGINSLADLSVEELKKYQGIGEVPAKRIVSAFGLANQIRKFKKDEEYIVRSPEDAAKYFNDLEGLQQEHFEAIFLNTKNVVIGRKNVFKGSLNASIVHPRETFKEAIRLSAASIIVAHNHPSGNATPSREDIEVTKRLKEVGQVTGIELLDHVIIGTSGKFISLKEKGYV
ncbi:RadC family protein [Radiobacillus deserti]|uniref:DNA repair protein RadC n=1 Tax=Radiobacillus deserti TaxID=2594883 RepID=A0A516KDF3_9BACI|nr:DNA repair protein RadC [Radiobacillus deserti]QDP39444.1 DNA repair protein RadC [Radiobacillus deserti]